jgi:photosystem II stability/assembly factor-like uncharacterized protein
MCRLAGVLLVMVSLVPAQSVPPEMLDGLPWRGIGPAATGGRIADLAISKLSGQPTTIYVATATGGVFKSVNDGVSFAPIFDRAGGMMSIGAVAVAPSSPSIVWVGTGEADNRQSSSWGDGVYKSVNGGLTWKKMGLEETRHIGKIVVDPTDPNIVWVAAVGHLWGSNPERGVYKTTDGGATWKRILYKDENTGAIDLAMDPRDPKVVFAALYQRQRKGWGFNGGGPGSGIYRTTDGGATWTEMLNGLPRGDKGRIGLATFAGDGRTVYAVIEADPGSSGGVFRSLNRGESWEHLSSQNPRPMYYSRIYLDPKDVNRVYLMGCGSPTMPDAAFARSSAAFTAKITSCGSTPIIPTASSPGEMAAFPSPTTAGSHGSSASICPSGSSITSRSTMASRIWSAAACRTTGTGVPPAPLKWPMVFPFRTLSISAAAMACRPSSRTIVPSW